jgi:hypothetical protein
MYRKQEPNFAGIPTTIIAPTPLTVASTSADSVNSGIGGGGGGGMGACQHHPHNPQPQSCSICSAWTQIELARRRLALQHEKLVLDKELLKNDRKKLRRQTSAGGGGQMYSPGHIHSPYATSGGGANMLVTSVSSFSPRTPLSGGRSTSSDDAASQHSRSSSSSPVPPPPPPNMTSDQLQQRLVQYEQEKLQWEDELEEWQQRLQQEQKDNIVKAREWKAQRIQLEERIQQLEEQQALQQPILMSNSAEVHDNDDTKKHELEKDELKEQIDQLQNKTLELQQENEAKSHQIDSLEIQVKALETTAAAAALALQQLDDERPCNKCTALKRQLDEQEMEMRDLEAQFKAMKHESSQRSRHSFVEDANDEDNDTASDAFNAAYANTIAKEEALAQQEAAQQQIEELQAQNQQLQERIDHLEKELDQLQQDDQGHQEKIIQQATEISRLQEDNHSLHMQQQQLQQQQQQSRHARRRSNGHVRTSSAESLPTSPTKERRSRRSESGKHVTEMEWRDAEQQAGKFTGWIDETGNPDGRGTWRVDDGSIYDGEWKHGKQHGTFD